MSLEKVQLSLLKNNPELPVVCEKTLNLVKKILPVESTLIASSYDLFRGNVSISSEDIQRFLQASRFSEIKNPPAAVPYDIKKKHEDSIDPAVIKNDINLSKIIGSSDAINKVKRDIYFVRDRLCKVLFNGESGTGKSMAANVLHKLSDRRNEKYVCVNVGAIHKDLVESTLFGTVKGAYTDAVNSNGLIHLASKGTLFLDEIAELPMDCQAKLLHALDDGTFRKVGSEKEEKTDARFVFATNANLKELVKKKMFREDLYWRIAEFIIEIPALRDRPEDIIKIAEHFLDDINSRSNRLKHFLSAGAREKMLSHRWPGNIRELKNCINISTIFASGEKINAEDIKFDSL